MVRCGNIHHPMIINGHGACVDKPRDTLPARSRALVAFAKMKEA